MMVVNAWAALGSGVLLLAACRQPNPEWKGPSGGSGDSDPSMTSADSEQADSSDGVVTEGQRCNNDNMCPDGWVCGPDGCQQGTEGNPCMASGNCQAPFDICGPDSTCQDGSEGDPCGENGHCMSPSGICGPTGTCQEGSAGDPCVEPSHCTGGLMCMEGVCG